ncbi:MAG TPA: DUF2934 domain-containing protein [Blastocatellia bacterium]|nr:DUF2934 domain-containing protein [Blastocatellia bacterium]
MTDEKLMMWRQRICQLALMTDTLKVQEILGKEYGIHLSEDETRKLQGFNPKIFTFRVIELWVVHQPQEALAWAASISWPDMIGVDILQLFLDAARKTMPNLNRKALDGMLPEGPGKAKALDLAEAATDPHSLANRILAMAHLAERVSHLKALAKGWPDPESSADWARQNLSGADKAVFYSQVGYNLAHRNPQAALQVLTELKGADTYAFTLVAMMRGLVQIGAQGRQVAELIANSGLDTRQRSRPISELARRWVRQDADAALAWANTLTEPEDIRAAIPLLVSQLKKDQVIRVLEAYLRSLDPVMEMALIEAAAPPCLVFNPRMSRLILDPIISKNPGLKLQSSEVDCNDGQSDLREMIARRAYELYEERGRCDGDDLNDWIRAEAEVKASVMAEKRRAIEEREMTREEILWRSVTLTARRLAEVGPPAAAMEWLGALPFASLSDYAKAAGVVLTVWRLKSPSGAAEWLQNSTLGSTLRSDLQEIVEQ